MSSQEYKTLAVLSCTAQAISFWDVQSGRLISSINGLLAEPHELLFDEGRKLLYASHTYRGGMYGFNDGLSKEISVIDTVGKRVMDVIDVSPARGPHALAMNHAKDTMWVTVEALSADTKGGLVEVDLKTRKVVKTVPCEAELHWFAMTADARKAYTCNKRYPFISVLDLESGSMKGKIDLPEGCEECWMSPDGKRAYFPTPGMRYGDTPKDGGAVAIINTSSDSIIGTIPTKKGYGPISVLVLPNNDLLVAEYCFAPRGPNGEPRPAPGLIEKFDAQGKLLGELQIGRMPLTMRCSPDGKLGFVANCRDGTVTVFDMLEMKALKLLEVDVVASEANKFETTSHGLALIP